MNDKQSDRLPAHLSAKPRRERVGIDRFPGLDVGKGGMKTMRNLSPRGGAALAVRRPRELLAEAQDGSAAHGMAVMGNALYVAQGTGLYRLTGNAGGLETVGTLSDTDKQMAVFGDRLYILPDKRYVDQSDGVLHPAELDSGEVANVEFRLNTITLPNGMTWKALGFGDGDGISVINADDVTPAPEGSYCIRRVHGRVAYLETEFQAAYVSRARITRTMPDMDRICVLGRRMYGFHGRDIYVSSEGSALCWGGERTDGKGAVVLHTDTEGALTACAPWQGYMVFFKADRILRLMGTRSDSLSLQEICAAGIPAALSETLCEIGGNLFYHSDTGVYRYGGAYPERIGVLSAQAMIQGCSGTDGVGYYLCLAADGEDGQAGQRLYLYMPEQETWYAEDELSIAHMCHWNGFLCIQAEDGRLWLCRSDGRRAGCAQDEATLGGPLEASVTLPVDHSFEPDGYRLTGIVLRATAPSGGELRILAAYADGRDSRDIDSTVPEAELAVIAGGMTDRLLRVPITAPPCDSHVLRLEMIGEWTVSSLWRDYEVRR